MLTIMHIKQLSLTALLLTFVSSYVLFSAAAKVSYDDLVDMDVSCFPFDTCTINLSDTLLTRSCECGEQCRKFQTCCIDSEYRLEYENASLHQVEQQEQCSTLYGTNNSYFLVRKCNPLWRGNPMVKSLCEDTASSARDPLAITPATNPVSNKTYINYFCAICNNDTQDLILWSIEIRVPSPEGESEELHDAEVNTTLDDLVYNDNVNTWGFFIETHNSSTFKHAIIDFLLPINLTGVVSHCIPDLISECDARWSNETVRSMCKTYMAAIFVSNASSENNTEPQIPYRNIHCAVCNFVNYTGGNICRIYSLDKKTKPMSFTLLLDVNTEDGDTVGQVDHCKKGETYDPFFKKCREMVCALPGFTLVDGQCAKI